MSETTEYAAGGESPVSGIAHLFTPEEQGSNGPAKSLCGAVGSYGPFRCASEVPEDELCENCLRVARQRRADAEDSEAETHD